MGPCRDGILVEREEMQVPSRAVRKMQGKPDSYSLRDTGFNCGFHQAQPILKIEVPNIFHKSAHTEDENFNLLIKIQRKYTFGRILKSYWKKNYYFYYTVQKKRSAFLKAHVCVCMLKTFLYVLLQIIYLVFDFVFLGITAAFTISTFHTNHFETEDSNFNLSRKKSWNVKKLPDKSRYLCTKNDSHYSHCKCDV